MFSISFAFPDTCKILMPAPTPTPLPNFAFSTMAIPNIFNFFITAMPVHNLGTTTSISTGNEVSAAGGGGVVSNLFIGSKRNSLGSFKTFFSCMPSTRMLDMSLQNGAASNIPGLNLSPCQIKILILA
ncbi:DUF4150 domain-containing protein [Paraneptunicella aestuarii]|nr:DUF4150 domain-containing protein [Paraneptunicella aestuarii]